MLTERKQEISLEIVDGGENQLWYLQATGVLV
jgi:hypothetical protein